MFEKGEQFVLGPQLIVFETGEWVPPGTPVVYLGPVIISGTPGWPQITHNVYEIMDGQLIGKTLRLIPHSETERSLRPADLGVAFKRVLQKALGKDVKIRDFTYSDDPDAHRIHFWVSCAEAAALYGRTCTWGERSVEEAADRMFRPLVEGEIGILPVWHVTGSKKGEFHFQINAFLVSER